MVPDTDHLAADGFGSMFTIGELSPVYESQPPW